MIVEIKKGSKRLANLLLPIIKTIKYQLDMNRIFIFAVAVITLTLTACGNKTQGGGDNDSLQTDSLQADDATKHTEEYIRQRIDTIYKYCGGKAVQIKGKVCDRSRFTTTRFNKLCAEVDRLCNVMDNIYFDYDIWVRGQDIDPKWSYKVKSVENITDSSAVARLLIHNFSDQNVVLDLRFERGDWYVNDFILSSGKYSEKDGELAGMREYVRLMGMAEKVRDNLDEMKRQFSASGDTDEDEDFIRWTPIDIDGDGNEEVYLTCGEGRNGAFYAFNGKKVQLLLVETHGMRAYICEHKNGKGYIYKGGSAGGPSYYNEVVAVQNSRIVERFNMLTIGSQLEEDAEPEVEASLNGKNVSKAKAEAYMKALPKSRELKIPDSDWHSEGID